MRHLIRSALRKYAKAEIEAIVLPIAEKILETVSPVKLVLFGSACTSAFDDESDLDFLVVFNKVEEAKAALLTLNRLRMKYDRSMDFICLDNESFEEARNRGGVAWVAEREGRVLFPQAR